MTNHERQSLPAIGKFGSDRYSSTRWWLGVLVVISTTLVLWLRLVQLQIVEGQAWASRADQNRLYGSLIDPSRAVAFDRYHDPLVFNVLDYYQLLDTTALFGPTLQVSPEEGLTVLATDSASVRQTFHRSYPLGPVLAHVLGYVTPVTAAELTVKDRQVTPTDQTGKQGLEQVFDRQLRGAPGEEQFEISALGIKRKMVQRQEAGAGVPIQTTLDPFLSAVSYRALGDNKGAVVIADARTGEVLTLVSSPAFDPNLLTFHSSDPASEAARKDAVQAMFADERLPFFNRAIAGTYPPGSIFKLVTALAALQSGKITAATEIVDEGTLKVGDFSYANWYYTQYGRTEGALSLRRAIARSNDIYFYKAAEAAGPDAIAQMAHTLGFGQPTGLELASEQAGLVPDPRWKEEVRGERWYLGNTYHFGIGQGDLLVTPVQVAQLLQTIGNDGSKCPLHLIQSATTNCENSGLIENDIRLVQQGMLDACSGGGTAYPFFEWNTQHSPEPGYSTVKDRALAGQVACKTGTAEFGTTDEKGFKKTHGWFVASLETKPLIENQFVASNSGELKQASLASASATASATASASATIVTRSLPLYYDKTRWLEEVKINGFPEKIVIVVLVESDKERPYREGSRDGAPVAKEIIDWMGV